MLVVLTFSALSSVLLGEGNDQKGIVLSAEICNTLTEVRAKRKTQTQMQVCTGNTVNVDITKALKRTICLRSELMSEQQRHSSKGPSERKIRNTYEMPMLTRIKT